MKYYIASSFANRFIVNKTITELNDLGLQNTYNWTVNRKAVNSIDLHRIGTAEMKAVLESDVFIAILPGGKGTHIEIGLALGNDIPVILAYSDKGFIELENATTFYYVDNVYHPELNKDTITSDLAELITRVSNKGSN